MIAIFTYGFKEAEDNFSQNNIKLNTLSNYTHLIKQAKDTNYISATEEELLSQWNANPSGWLQ
jgi:orotate phosphoribosyltransferase